MEVLVLTNGVLLYWIFWYFILDYKTEIYVTFYCLNVTPVGILSVGSLYKSSGFISAYGDFCPLQEYIFYVVGDTVGVWVTTGLLRKGVGLSPNVVDVSSEECW